MPVYVECVFDHHSAMQGQLAFAAGELIEVLQQGEPNDWWEGRLSSSGVVGWFPSAYCSAPWDDGAGVSQRDEDAPVGQRATALYSYVAESPDELSFEAGDVIYVQQSDQSWWTGTLDGRSGAFPSNYVELEVDDWGATSTGGASAGAKAGAAIGDALAAALARARGTSNPPAPAPAAPAAGTRRRRRAACTSARAPRSTRRRCSRPLDRRASSRTTTTAAAAATRRRRSTAAPGSWSVRCTTRV